MSTGLSTKANTSDLAAYYTKTQVDNLLSGKLDNNALSSYYTQTQVNTLLNGKVDNSTLTTNYYTKSDVNTALAGKVDNATLNSYYTIPQITSLLQAKADAASLSAVALSGAYSDLSGVPTALSAFLNDIGAVTSSEVTSIEVVAALPANPSDDVIYIISDNI